MLPSSPAAPLLDRALPSPGALVDNAEKGAQKVVDTLSSVVPPRSAVVDGLREANQRFGGLVVPAVPVASGAAKLYSRFFGSSDK